MSIAPHTGIVDFGVFAAPTVSADGIQGEVPQPLAGQETHILSASGWVPPSSGSGTVTSVAASVPTGLSISGSPITTSGTLAISYTTGYSIPTVASQTSWDTAYTDRLKWDGGSSGLVAATGRTSLGLVIGTDVLAPNGSAANLTSFPTFNQNTSGTASNVTGIVAIANGGTGASDATNARANLTAAKSGANTDITSVALTTGTITTTPVTNTDIVNKQYADAIASGINFHEAVNLATTAALPANTYNNGTSGVGATLTATANGALSVDSTLTIVAERILVKNEAAGANNGVYVVTQVGSAGTPYILTRATDFNTVGTGVGQIDDGDFFLVTSGVANVNTAWVQQTPPPITIGTTAIVFQQFSAPITYTAGTGLSESPSYTFNIANIGTAGTYGSASQVPVLTTNAQGQVTGVTNTAIAIGNSNLANSAITINGTATSLGGSISVGTVTSVGGTGTINGITLTGTVTSSGSLTLGGALSGVSLTTQVADILPVVNGGTGTATPSLVAGTNITISGSFPNQTINASSSGSGTVTSVAVSGGTTGLTTSGGPVTTSGTITLAGTLDVDNGGTGQTTYTNGQLLIGNTTGNTLAKATLTQGTGVVITNGAGTITIAGALAESTSVFVTGTAQTYTAPANTQWVKITVVGPGGNGAGVNNQRTTGGGGGGVARKAVIMAPGQTLTYTVGTASGTASTVSSGTLAITTISGGSGANGAGTAYAASVTAGPAGGTASGGDINITGGRGGSSFGSSTTVLTNFSGRGGDCPGFGTGGLAVGCVATAGTVGNGFGAGGGGSHGNNTAAAGTGGVIIFEAY